MAGEINSYNQISTAKQLLIHKLQGLIARLCFLLLSHQESTRNDIYQNTKAETWKEMKNQRSTKNAISIVRGRSEK